MNSIRITDTAVIGAGASGLMAAAAAAAMGASVLVLEKQDKPGKKLLMTGNGRCNLTHIDSKLSEAYHSSDPDALKDMTVSLFTRFGTAFTLRYFEKLGLWCHDRDGYVYPRSDQAASVLHALIAECDRLKVKRKYRAEVTELIRVSEKAEGSGSGDYWKICTADWTYYARTVILAGGSAAGLGSEQETGCDFLLKEAMKYGHTVIPQVPALTGLRIRHPFLQEAAGARTDAVIRLTASKRLEGTVHEEEIGCETGQIQWNRDGISGICVMQLSGYVSRFFQRKRPGNAGSDDTSLSVCIDLVPGMDLETVAEALAVTAGRMSCPEDAGQWTKAQVTGLLSGFIPEKTALMLYSMFRETDCSHRTPETLARLLKNLTLPVSGVRDMRQAQVAAGGIALAEIESGSMQSKRCAHMYFAGEILDCDGPCGGYNLQWAWSTGLAAGMAAADAALKGRDTDNSV